MIPGFQKCYGYRFDENQRLNDPYGDRRDYDHENGNRGNGRYPDVDGYRRDHYEQQRNAGGCGTEPDYYHARRDHAEYQEMCNATRKVSRSWISSHSDEASSISLVYTDQDFIQVIDFTKRVDLRLMN